MADDPEPERKRRKLAKANVVLPAPAPDLVNAAALKDYLDVAVPTGTEFRDLEHVGNLPASIKLFAVNTGFKDEFEAVSADFNKFLKKYPRKDPGYVVVDVNEAYYVARQLVAAYDETKFLLRIALHTWLIETSQDKLYTLMLLLTFMSTASFMHWKLQETQDVEKPKAEWNAEDRQEAAEDGTDCIIRESWIWATSIARMALYRKNGSWDEWSKKWWKENFEDKLAAPPTLVSPGRKKDMN